MIKRILTVASLLASTAFAAPNKFSFDENGVCEMNGQKMFPLSVAVIPPPDAKAPNGKTAWEEFSDGGINAARVIPGMKGKIYGWNDEGYKAAKDYLDAIAPAHIYAWLWLGEEIAHFGPNDTAKQAELKKVVETFKDHPGLGFWKGEDEPLWGEMNSKEPGSKSPAALERPYKMIHEMDPNHPVVVIQAPRGTEQQLAAYRDVLDVTGMDVFAISYPPGIHIPAWPNHEISMVGDWTKIIVQAAGGKPVWMTLQVSWSGVTNKGRTLRFPTFEQERFMTYEAIIDGARGLNYFGGSNLTTLNDRDRELGYNWTFWDKVLKPLLAEINEKSPLHEAMVAPNSKMPVKVDGKGIEYVVREVGNDVYILACKREGDTIEVKFSGLPSSVSSGEVLYEEPRKVSAKDGSFKDWFGPFEVHVYHFKR